MLYSKYLIKGVQINMLNMFNISSISDDTFLEDAVTVSIISYDDFVTRTAKMKQDGTYLMFPKGVLCYLVPFKGADGVHTFFDVKVPTSNGELMKVITIIVADKGKSESLILLENKEIINEIGLAYILHEVSTILHEYK